MKRIMIAGTNSGCGKTTVTCAILQALVNRKVNVTSFKCGPDYIDPMFHSRIIGTKSRNIDSWFCDSKTINYLLEKNAGEISVIESVMGFYDGVRGKSSSWGIACDTKTPVIMVVDCKGMSSSVGAVMKGFLTFRNPNKICGFVFNRLPEKLVPEIKSLCDELGTEYLGRLPYDRSCSFESRHLGLVTADEIADIKSKLNTLAGYAEKYIDIDRLTELAEITEKLDSLCPVIADLCSKNPVKIAVAADSTFCFIYEDNLDVLRETGCEIVKFSPLNDSRLPEGISGIILCGGYPELYLDRLSANKKMLEQIKNAIENNMPVIAECGGFMYLHKQIKDENGVMHEMAGAVDGTAYKTEKLQRFGYTFLTAENDNMLCRNGEEIKTHEFHYWDSTSCGNDFTARKASNGEEYRAVHADMHSYMGFPHLYFYSDVKIAENFVKACMKYRSEYEKNQTDN